MPTTAWVLHGQPLKNQTWLGKLILFIYIFKVINAYMALLVEQNQNVGHMDCFVVEKMINHPATSTHLMRGVSITITTSLLIILILYLYFYNFIYKFIFVNITALPLFILGDLITKLSIKLPKRIL